MSFSPYQMITRRKSFHTFKSTDKLSASDLDLVNRAIASAEPLIPDIQTEIVLVPAKETSGGRGGEYCLLFYSEHKDGRLENIGYIGEQIDLMLQSQGIGTLWLGFGRTKAKKHNDLDFIIMMAIGKVKAEQLRTGEDEFKRKDMAEIWQGITPNWALPVRFAPSACNSQPWLVKNNDNILEISRHSRHSGVIPAAMLLPFNRMDMGIFLYFLELCMKENNICFNRKLLPEGDQVSLDSPFAEYSLS